MPSEKTTDWQYDHKAKPSATGWHPVALSWGTPDGVVPAGAIWDGSKWSVGNCVLGFMDRTFANEAEAFDCAHAHDPETSRWQE